MCFTRNTHKVRKTVRGHQEGSLGGEETGYSDKKEGKGIMEQEGLNEVGDGRTDYDER